MKADYTADSYLDPNNGFKDQLRNLFGVQIFDIENNNEEANSSVGDFNTIINAKGKKLPLTLFLRSISGLPTFEMDEVVDTYFGGIENVLPGKMMGTSGALTLSTIITEDLNPIRSFFKYFFKLHQTQTSIDDVILLAEENGGVSFDSPSELALALNVVENTEEELSGNDSIYFKLVANYLKYTDRSPILSYVLYNCWVKSIKIHESSTAENSADLQRADITIRYDLGRVTTPKKD